MHPVGQEASAEVPDGPSRMLPPFGQIDPDSIGFRNDVRLGRFLAYHDGGLANRPLQVVDRAAGTVLPGNVQKRFAVVTR